MPHGWCVSLPCVLLWCCLGQELFLETLGEETLRVAQASRRKVRGQPAAAAAAACECQPAPLTAACKEACVRDLPPSCLVFVLAVVVALLLCHQALKPEDVASGMRRKDRLAFLRPDFPLDTTTSTAAKKTGNTNKYVQRLALKSFIVVRS